MATKNLNYFYQQTHWSAAVRLQSGQVKPGLWTGEAYTKLSGSPGLGVAPLLDGLDWTLSSSELVYLGDEERRINGK